jgi:hypothetical protein
MKLLSKESIIFYSILGAVTAFILAPFIRSLIDFSTPIEILITYFNNYSNLYYC